MAEDLTKGRPFSVILKFSLPIIGGNLFQLFYTLADTIIVGQTIGEDALAAVGATTVFVYFILCFIQGLTNGFSIILAHSIGARDYGDARRNIAASIYISLVCTVVITSITCAMAGWIIDIMEVPLEIKEDATVYLVVVLAGTGATILYNLISNILRALGDSRLPLIYLVFSSVLNVVLDIVFIVPFGMGVGGAALATVLSLLIAGILSFASAIRRYDVLRLRKEDWACSAGKIMANLRLGFLMGFQMSVMCIGQLVMQTSVNSLGTEAIAGYTAATKVDQLSVLVNNAFITAIAAYVAQNFGASDNERIRKGVWNALAITEITDFLMIAIILIIEPYIVPMFVSDASPAVYGYAWDFFKITLPFYPMLGLLCVYRTSVQAMGNSIAPFVACIVELVARSASSIILASVIGYAGVVFSSPLAWIGADLIVIPSYVYMMRRLKRGKR